MKVVKTVEGFAGMTSGEIAEPIRTDLSLWIMGDIPGKDRAIIEKSN